MVEIKTPEQIAKMRAAGLVVAEALKACREAVAPGITTQELNDIADKVITDHGATSNFRAHHGGLWFPGVICASVNDEIVHGIPGERVLQEGDLISIDCGAILDGWHGDAAITVAVGEVAAEHTQLSRVTEGSMWAGIAQMKKGNRLVDVSRSIESFIRRQPLPPKGKWGIVEGYGGHGIGTAMHMEPHVLNYVAGRGKGPKLIPGTVLAIEPMVTLGTPHSAVLEDDWTVVTTDKSWASHWEHSVAVTEQGPLVLTAFDGGRAELAKLGVTAAPDPLA
ncbi:type I methionyl aminopeptidase [Kitasatospora sp. DSM 101779]|uniref:type I methionyl aminopeptidase n=1 Tax=Kitasatospora sp. DSM 101779 TaxID=2853165 RepID=UPI0021DA30F3|nr:type I methionyl aminopeptidase [Kitasatospora sp. DSM 101779]MCU7824312.1 type I methionyl aminopeptidase [Kitasatospora sp. DSM 101779]